MTKTCTRCTREQDLDEFYYHPKGAKKRSSWCKSCYKEFNRDKRRNGMSPERRERAEIYEQERELEGKGDIYSRRFRLKKKYGMTISDYHALLAEQDGACAICGEPPSDPRGYPLHVDHNHATGEVRGLLCTSCNNGIGRFKDSAELLEKAADYLKKRGVLSGEGTRISLVH